MACKRCVFSPILHLSHSSWLRQSFICAPPQTREALVFAGVFSSPNLRASVESQELLETLKTQEFIFHPPSLPPDLLKQIETLSIVVCP